MPHTCSSCFNACDRCTPDLAAASAHTRELSRLAAAYREAWEAAEHCLHVLILGTNSDTPERRAGVDRCNALKRREREAHEALLAHVRGER